MRIKEEIKKSGFFWLPSNPERKIPGLLLIRDGGDIELEVVGLFEKSSDNPIEAIQETLEMARIVGHIEDHGLVTLENCYYKTKSFAFGGIAKSTIHASTVFLGVGYQDNEEVLFKTFQFSVEGIDEWVGLTGIKIKYEECVTTIAYTPLEEIKLDIKNGMKLFITFMWTLPGLPLLTEAKITQKAYFKFVSEKEQPLTEFITAAFKIANLLAFAIGETVCIEHVSATSETILKKSADGTSFEFPIEIYYPSLPYTKVKPKIDRYRMLFCFGQIQNDAERIVNNWFAAYDIFAPALNLYFSAKNGVHKYLDAKFLALVQGLETYHRRTSNDTLMDDVMFKELTEKLISQCPAEHKEWLSGRLKHGNEVSLRGRIKSIIEPYKEIFGEPQEQKKLVRGIVETRNYLTHFDKSLESTVSTGIELWRLYSKMAAIFQLHLLQVLGFTSDEIKTILNNSRELQQKLKNEE